MCAGALHAARIDRCVYGAVDPKAGALGTLYDIASDERLNHRYEVTAGVLAEESAALLRAFFAALRSGGARDGAAGGLRARPRCRARGARSVLPRALARWRAAQRGIRDCPCRRAHGELSEWLKEHDWKSCVRC